MPTTHNPDRSIDVMRYEYDDNIDNLKVHDTCCHTCAHWVRNNPTNCYEIDCIAIHIGSWRYDLRKCKTYGRPNNFKDMHVCDRCKEIRLSNLNNNLRSLLKEKNIDLSRHFLGIYFHDMNDIKIMRKMWIWKRKFYMTTKKEDNNTYIKETFKIESQIVNVAWNTIKSLS